VHLQESAKPIFFSDVSPEEADIAWDNLFKQQSRKSITTFPQYVESEIRCPKTYVVCEKDQAVPPAFQEQMAGMGGFNIVKVSSGHAPFLTVPNEIVAAILRAHA
jgi:hypothetical protein